eukprot:1156013-Pelagomonas_calceolata.AAC.5
MFSMLRECKDAHWRHEQLSEPGWGVPGIQFQCADKKQCHMHLSVSPGAAEVQVWQTNPDFQDSNVICGCMVKLGWQSVDLQASLGCLAGRLCMSVCDSDFAPSLLQSSLWALKSMQMDAEIGVEQIDTLFN